jgi:hypothetical protein
LLGRLYERTGDLAAAEQAFERARHAAERASNQRNVTGAGNSLGDVGAARGDLSCASRGGAAGPIPILSRAIIWSGNLTASKGRVISLQRCSIHCNSESGHDATIVVPYLAAGAV